MHAPIIFISHFELTPLNSFTFLGGGSRLYLDFAWEAETCNPEAVHGKGSKLDLIYII